MPHAVDSSGLPPLSHYEEVLARAEKLQGDSPGRQAWRKLRRHRAAMFCLWTLVGIVLLAVATPLLPLQSPRAIDLGRMYEAPRLDAPAVRLAEVRAALDLPDAAQREKRLAAASEALFGSLFPWDAALVRGRFALFGDYGLPSWCGTDNLGHDVLSRLCWGLRVSLAVGLAAALVSLFIGVTYGAVSGYVGGWVDGLMMRFLEMLYSVPFFFIVIFLITILNSVKDLSPDQAQAWAVSVFGGSLPPSPADGTPRVMPFWAQFLILMQSNRLFALFLVIGAVYWMTMARVVRGQVLSLKHELFVEAARTLGAGRTWIILRHLVPNVMGVVIVYLTLTIPSVILFEAFLSFLGLGVEAPDASFGVLASDGIKVLTPVKTAWWLIFFPGFGMVVMLLALNVFGDALRDALDPRLKNSQ